jgi:hypothetical protein
VDRIFDLRTNDNSFFVTTVLSPILYGAANQTGKYGKRKSAEKGIGNSDGRKCRTNMGTSIPYYSTPLPPFSSSVSIITKTYSRLYSNYGHNLDYVHHMLLAAQACADK